MTPPALSSPSPPLEAVALLTTTAPARSSIERRFLHASGLVTIGAIASRAVSLAIGIVSARLLSEAEFGALGLIQSTLGMFGAAAGLSLGLAATRYVARYRSSEPDRVRGVLLVTLGIGTLSTLVSAAALFVSAPWIASLGGKPGVVVALRWAALQLIFTSLFGIVAGALAGKERFGVVGSTAVLQNVLILVASLLFIPALHLSGAVAAQAAGLAAALAVACWSIRELLTGWSWREWRTAVRRERALLLEFCLPNLLASALMLPAAWGSTMLIFNRPDGDVELAFFTAADRFRLLLSFVTGFVGTALLPILSGAAAAGTRDGGEGGRGLELGLLATGLLVVPLTALLAFGGPALMAVFGKSYQTNWSVLLPVLAWGAAGAVGSIVGTALVAHGRQWFIFLQQASYGATVLALTFVLRDLGGAGLALAHLGAVLFLLAWSYPALRSLGILSRRVTRQLICLTAVVCVICAASWMCPEGWRLTMAMPATVSAAVCALSMSTRVERRRLLGFVRAPRRAF